MNNLKEKVVNQNATLTMLFRIGKSLYGLDTSIVQEVVRVGELTTVPGAPKDIVGVRNLRGKIVTVIDLAIQLNVDSKPRSSENRLVLLEHYGDSYGFLVDSVSEAVIIKEEEIMPPTSNLDLEYTHSLRGLWRTGNDIVSIIDPEKIFNWRIDSEHSLSL